VLARVTRGFAHRAAASGSPARVLYADDRAGHPDAVDGLESFSRLALIWGAWLRNPGNPNCLRSGGQEIDVAALLARGLREGTDPEAGTYWGDIGHMDQRIVEAANLALAVWLSRERVLSQLTQAEQARVLGWLAQVDGKGTYPDNWVMFPALSQVVRLKLGWPAPEADLRERLAQMAAFYRGDGWYVDGPGDEFDLYNAWMFGCHYWLWAWMDGERWPALAEQIRQRARSFLAGFLHFFGANGAHVAWGRSLGSRFGALAAFTAGTLLGVAPDPAGRLRRASSGCLRYFWERGLFAPGQDSFTQGYHGHAPRAVESYVSPGSPNSALEGLLALTLDENDPFWTEAEGPLPVEEGDFELVLPAPGFVVTGHHLTGEVRLLNSRAGHAPDVARHHYTPKYGKLAYSTHHPFNVAPAGSSYAPDAMLALTSDGRTFGHRALTRQGGAAPGIIWCHFDEMLEGEPQAIRAAVVLWGDVQVLVAHVHPTLPVWACYAPGALGCERPVLIRRRSDRAAGWEYAEVEGRAVGVRRLLGFDEQAASAPFQGDSALNLAYAYAEQPIVSEREASASPRGLACLGLVRAAGFAPETALAGFSVTHSARDEFRIWGPDGGEAAVSLAPELPQTLSIGPTTFEGPAVRYARSLPSGRGGCGLGIRLAGGMAKFARPATFRLERQPEGHVYLSTNSGAVLDEAWLGGPAARAAAQTLDGAWEDLGAMPGGELPDALVRTWQTRNQREMVAFRVWT
jgi:hypothetical protein